MLGMSKLVATVLRPIIFAIYSVPLVSLAPLLIMIFGIDMLPKMVLVATVVFFLVLFNTMKGVEMVDPDTVDVLKVMGGKWHESFRKVLLPGCMVWILSGVKVALPYALVAMVSIATIARISFFIVGSFVDVNDATLYN